VNDPDPGYLVALNDSVGKVHRLAHMDSRRGWITDDNGTIKTLCGQSTQMMRLISAKWLDDRSVSGCQHCW